MQNKAQSAASEIRAMDDLAVMDSPMHHLSPTAKVLMTVFYILTVVSFGKYDFSGLFIMVLFPILGYQLSFIPVSTCFKKLWVVMPLVCAVGLANPFFDRAVMVKIGALSVSGGVISMLTLMLKGIFCLMASFLLIATTGMEGICHALRGLHVPKLLTTLLLLTYRYIGVLLDEVALMNESYHLRAPNQKGIHISAWGSFLGQLLLRTMDRAQNLYDAMLLRGFDGDYPFHAHRHAAGWIVIPVTAMMLICRFVPIAALLGKLV